VRRLYGGTHSLQFKRGALVRHPKWGLSYVGGTSKGRISLHSIGTGQRLARNVHQADCRIRAPYNSWRARLLPAVNSGAASGRSRTAVYSTALITRSFPRCSGTD
jgi:hypothetical protein